MRNLYTLSLEKDSPTFAIISSCYFCSFSSKYGVWEEVWKLTKKSERKKNCWKNKNRCDFSYLSLMSRQNHAKKPFFKILFSWIVEQRDKWWRCSSTIMICVFSLQYKNCPLGGQKMRKRSHLASRHFLCGTFLVSNFILL